MLPFSVKAIVSVPSTASVAVVANVTVAPLAPVASFVTLAIENVGAVVSRGGRPDLAGEALDKVRAPTLLIVGGNDTAVIEMNRAALARLRGEKQLQIIPGASHLFEEPGALEAVARLALDWFQRYLPPPEPPAARPHPSATAPLRRP